MALYYIGKNEKDITGISSFAGSETIYGSNEHENYARFSFSDEDKPLTEQQEQLSYLDLRYAMEKFKILDKDAKFVFSDKELMEKVLSHTSKEMTVTDNDYSFVEDLKSIQ